MFSTNLAESQQDQITLKDMEARTLSLVLDYIYTGQVSVDVANFSLKKTLSLIR